MKYTIPKNWRQICDGMGCHCGAYDRGECGCDCDWTTAETYELQEEVNALHAEIGRMREGVRATAAYCRRCQQINHLTPHTV